MLGSHILKFSARYYKVLPGFTKYLQVLAGEFGFLAKLKIEREHIWRLVVAHCPLSLRYAGCILGTAEYKSDQTSFQCWTAMVKAVSPNGSYQEGFHNVLQCRKSNFSEDYNTSDARHTTW